VSFKFNPNSQNSVNFLLLGGKTYTLLRNLTAPNKPKEKDYTTLVNLPRDHLTPKPIVIAERFRFHKRNFVAVLHPRNAVGIIGKNVSRHYDS
jgi:hypothetical protein